MKHVIDAQGKKIGRIASQAASVLLGKSSTSIKKNIVNGDTVEIINASGADMSAKKLIDMKYVTYTGHRGGLNTETLGALIDRRGMEEVFRRAIFTMLPKNKLRDKIMKNLTVKE